MLDHLVVRARKQRISRARAAVGVDRKVLEVRIRRQVQGQQRYKSSSQAVSADRHRADRLREGKRCQRVDDRWRTSGITRSKGIVHGGDAIFRVAGSREERAWYKEKMGVVDPLLNSFRAANRDGDIPSSVRLADKPDRDLLIATARIDVCREVV